MTKATGRPAALMRQMRDAWSLIGPYFCARTPVSANLGRLGRCVVAERWLACSLLCAIVTVEIGQVWLTVLLNEWNARFFNAIQDKNFQAFWCELIVFAVIAATFVAIGTYQLYLTQWLHMRWRSWMTARYLERWLQHGMHYRMRLGGDPADNPDQRIADDIEMLVDHSLSLGIGFLSSFMLLASFIVILWGLSAGLWFPIGGHVVIVPGLLVWVALLFALAGTVGAHRIGKHLIKLNFTKQRCEADFRYALVRLRENAESVALARGEDREARLLAQRFAGIASNWHETMSRQKRLSFFTTGYSQVAAVLPTIIVAPYYFAGLASLGALTQTGGAFGQVQTALSFFVHAYTRLAQWRAVIDRLIGFETQMVLAANLARQGLQERQTGRPEAPLALEAIELRLPDGTPLVTGAGLTVRRGEAVLLSGAPGSGKSTLLRAIGGIWPYASGLVTLAPGARLQILSQRPYFPLGSLGAAVAYPGSEADVELCAISSVLAQVGLSRLIGRNTEIAAWSEVLSPGEQQRLAFGRALLHMPDVLLLDEATSALDEASEAALYRLLRRKLPDAAILSIGHRSTLVSLHDRCITYSEPLSRPEVHGLGGDALDPAAARSAVPELQIT